LVGERFDGCLLLISHQLPPNPTKVFIFAKPPKCKRKFINFISVILRNWRKIKIFNPHSSIASIEVSPMAQVSRICNGVQNPSLISNLSKSSQRKSPLSVSLKTQQHPRAYPISSSWGLKKSGMTLIGSELRPLKVMSSVSTAEKASEIVLQPIREISGLIKLPGSKSLSNRILLLAALSEVYITSFRPSL